MSNTTVTRLIKTSTPCCLTGSNEAVVVAERDRHGKPLRTVISTASGLVFTDPRPTAEDIRRFYSEEYRLQYKQTFTPKLKHILRAGRLSRFRLSMISEWLRPGFRVLDAGSGGGEFVHTLRSAGYDAQGIEPNEGYARHSIDSYGLRIFNGFYQDAPFEPGEFDCVTLFHVLEHLEQPIEALRLLAGWIRPGGKLVVEVPDVETLETAPGQKWHLGHLYNFSLTTLTAAGVKAGLVPVRVQQDPNLFAVFEKPAEAIDQPRLDELLRGSFEQTHQLLARHTLLRHYSRPQVPLSRLVHKTRRMVDEWSVVRRYNEKGPADLLEDFAAGKVA